MVIWSILAKKDLKTLHDYIERDFVYYAKHVTERIIKKTELLKQFPNMGRIVPEIGDNNIKEISVYLISKPKNAPDNFDATPSRRK